MCPDPCWQSAEALVATSYQVSAWWTRTWEKRVPEKGQARYYRLSLQQNLWGDWELHRSWGRIGHRPTRKIRVLISGQEEAETIAAQIHRRRLRHGYLIIK